MRPSNHAGCVDIYQLYQVASCLLQTPSACLVMLFGKVAPQSPLSLTHTRLCPSIPIQNEHQPGRTSCERWQALEAPAPPSPLPAEPSSHTEPPLWPRSRPAAKLPPWPGMLKSARKGAAASPRPQTLAPPKPREPSPWPVPALRGASRLPSC